MASTVVHPWPGDGICDEECRSHACQDDRGDCAGQCAPGCEKAWLRVEVLLPRSQALTGARRVVLLRLGAAVEPNHAGGVGEYGDTLVRGDLLHPAFAGFVARGERGGVRVEAALRWCKGAFGDRLVTFANGIRTGDGGAHLDGLRAAVARAAISVPILAAASTLFLVPVCSRLPPDPVNFPVFTSTTVIASVRSITSDPPEGSQTLRSKAFINCSSTR